MSRFSLRRRLAALAVAAGMVGGMALAAPAARAQKGEQLTEAKALDLQEKFEDAQLAGDAATVASLMADNAVFVHGNMRTQSKAEFVGGIGGRGGRGGRGLGGFDGPDRKVLLFDGGALVTGPVTLRMGPAPDAAVGTPPREMHIYLSTLWVHMPAGWQVLLSQTTELTPGGPGGRGDARSDPGR